MSNTLNNTLALHKAIANKVIRNARETDPADINDKKNIVISPEVLVLAVQDALADVLNGRPVGELSAIQLIAAERKRQIDVEHFTPESDDKLHPNLLPAAAAAYADHVSRRQWLFDTYYISGIDNSAVYREDEAPDSWPWANSWWKPKDPLSDLVRAGALIAAAIEKHQRADPEQAP
jgi:hypothetical protein